MSARVALPRVQNLEWLFSLAANDATAAMCLWTGGQITPSLDALQEVEIGAGCTALGAGDRRLTMIAMDVVGPARGHMLLAFDEEHDRRFAAKLLGETGLLDGPWTEMEKSVLMETGNILGSVYTNALSRALGIVLFPSPPCFIQDYAAAVLEQVVQKRALNCDRVLVCRTSFELRGGNLRWQVLFIPGDSLRRRMESVDGVER